MMKGHTYKHSHTHVQILTHTHRKRERKREGGYRDNIRIVRNWETDCTQRQSYQLFKRLRDPDRDG